MGLRIRDQCIGLRLASGSGSSRDTYHRQHLSTGLPISPVVFHGSAAGQQEVDSLGRVHRTAAPQPNDRVDPQRGSEPSAGVDHECGGVRIKIVECEYSDARPAQQVLGGFDIAAVDDALIRDKQGPAEAKLRCQLAEPLNRPLSKYQSGRALKIEMLHTIAWD